MRCCAVLCGVVCCSVVWRGVVRGAKMPTPQTHSALLVQSLDALLDGAKVGLDGLHDLAQRRLQLQEVRGER